jgi:SAM-dependent methyltransferase|tara:strand:+ start:1781 stop:3304 length:1524 start_codon:yes stop_codon:yes gene_type:complete
MLSYKDGYVSDITYTKGYYEALNPLKAKLVFLQQGQKFPEVTNACELGFGQGVSVNFHAAGSQTNWFGTDFLEEHASYAKTLGVASIARLKLFDESLEAFCERADLPDFDFIGLHGVWSWISSKNRSLIVRFLQKKLKPGGVLYVSYNALPGSGRKSAIRDLLTLFSKDQGSKSGPDEGILRAFQQTSKLLNLSPRYQKSNPSVIKLVKKLEGDSARYLAHEFLNENHDAMNFTEIAGLLNDAKMRFVGEANCCRNIRSLNLTKDQRIALRDVDDSVLRETMTDYLLNTEFRRDYWVKDDGSSEKGFDAAALEQTRVMNTSQKPTLPSHIRTNIGRVKLNTEIYSRLIESLSCYQTKSIAEVETELSGANISVGRTRQALAVLSDLNQVALVQNDAQAFASYAQTQRLNRYILLEDPSLAERNILVSPVSGGGIRLTRLQMLFLREALVQGYDPDQWKLTEAQTRDLLRTNLGKVSVTQRLTQEQFLDRAKTFFGDQGAFLDALKLV